MAKWINLCNLLFLLGLSSISRKALANNNTCDGLQAVLDAINADQFTWDPLLTVTLPGPFTYPDEQFNITYIRPGIHVYEDAFYKSTIIYSRKELLVIDPVRAGSTYDSNGKYKLLTALDEIIGSTVPKKVGILYSHPHTDHIGNAMQVVNYTNTKFPDVKVEVYGTEVIEPFFIVHNLTEVLPAPTRIIPIENSKLKVGNITIFTLTESGHEEHDLLLHVRPNGPYPGFIHFVDYISPGSAPFLHIYDSQDIHEYIHSHERVLELDFEICNCGHGLMGQKVDVLQNYLYIQDVEKYAFEATAPGVVNGGPAFQVFWDPTSRGYRNQLLLFKDLYRGWTKYCQLKVIEKWGCILTGVDSLAASHCEQMLLYNAHFALA